MNEREIYSRPHPPACTCVSCVEKRLRRKKGFWTRLKDSFKRKR